MIFVETMGEPTPLAAREAARLLVARERARGRTPTLPAVELKLAQLWFENDHGRAVYQYNWGNISAPEPGPSSSWKGDIYRPPWFEDKSDQSSMGPWGEGGKMAKLHQAMLDGKAPRAFRAYLGHPEGMDGFLSVLEHRYPLLVAAANAGDAQAYGRAARTSGYCPDCPGTLGNTLESLRAELRASGAFDGLGLSAGAGGATSGLGELALAAGIGFSVLKGWI